MKDLIARSMGMLLRATPAPLRRVLGPALNPVLRAMMRMPAPPPVVRTGAYAVRVPRAPVGHGPRVMHMIGNFLTGGSSRLVVDLYERLGHRYAQHVVTQVLPTPLAYTGIPVVQINARDSAQPYVEAIRDFRPDLIHVHYWGDCDTPWYERVFEAAQATGTPVIQNVNTPVEPFVHASVCEYVYVSDYVRRRFPAEGARQSVVYPGSDFGFFRPPLLRAGTGTRVGMVYRLEPDKLNAEGIEPMIEAARLDPQLRCIVVGGGTFYEEYRSRVRAAGCEARFDFPGYVAYEALPALYRDIAIFVAPVWKESFGQVSPFAMAMGIPVVGYDVGAIPEIVDDATLLAPAGDARRLGAIIAELMRDPQRRRRIGERNRARARRFYSVEAMVEHYDRIYAGHLAKARA